MAEAARQARRRDHRHQGRLGDGGGKKGLSKATSRGRRRSRCAGSAPTISILYQSHRDDPDTPIEETLEAYGALIKAGKVRAIGASNFTPERLAASLRRARSTTCRATRRCSRNTI
jgi:diketogulonate reductase-like aldo/keto reductase